MAKQEGSYYTGRRGDFTYYKWMGIPCCRKIAVGIKQTKATRADSNIFKLASPMAKSFRQLFGEVIQHPKERTMQLKWVGAVKRWLNARQNGQIPVGDLAYVSGFQFHVESDLRDRLHVPVTVSPQPGVGLQLHIPAFVPMLAIGVPAHTVSIKMKIVAASASTKDGVAIDSYFTEITIPYTQDILPEQTISLPLQSDAGTVSLVTIALEYSTLKAGVQRVLTDKKFIPCGVVGGWVIEEVERVVEIGVRSKNLVVKSDHRKLGQAPQEAGLAWTQDAASWLARTGYTARVIVFLFIQKFITPHILLPLRS